MSEIIPGLWISTIKDSKKYNFEKNKNIKLFINCENNLSFMNNIDKNKLNIADISINKICIYLINYWKKKSKEIYESLNNYKNVIIYCNDLNKSISLIISYLIIYGNLNIISAINTIHSKVSSSYFPNEIYSDALKLLYKNKNYS